MRKWTGSLVSDSYIDAHECISEQKQLPTIQKLLETENLREFTEETITNLAIELRHIIVEVRDQPDVCFSKCVSSKDAILKNLRNASIELNLALDQLEMKRKSPRFYKHLLACKENLEKVSEMQENEAVVSIDREKQVSLLSINSSNSVPLIPDLFLVQVQEYLTVLASLQPLLHHTYKLLNEEDEIWTDQCNRPITALGTMSNVIHKLCDLFDGSIQLPSVLTSSNYEYMVTLYHIDEQVRKLSALFTSFRTVCRSTSRQSIRRREEILGKLAALIQNNDDILQRLSMLTRQRNVQKEATSRHLWLIPQEA